MNENKNILQDTEKVFTQADVNRIIGERLSRDKLRGSEEFERRETELAERELKFTAKQLLSEKGLPTELAEILKLEDEKSVTEAIELLAKLMGTREKTETLKNAKERKLPVSERTDENYGQLRRAFGLV
jgi:hypothetical protein